MKISLGSWALVFGPYTDHPYSFEATARLLSEAGYDGIEVGGFAPHISLDAYPAAESRRAVVKMLEDLNLGVSGYAADLGSVNPTVPGNRQKYLDLFQRNVEMCVDIGSPSIRVDSVAPPTAYPDEKDFQATMEHLASVWRDAATIAAKAGVRLVWEFEPGFLFNRPSDVVALHDKVNHSNFRIMFDTSHAYMCGVVGARQRGEKETVPGGVLGFLKKLSGRIGAIHLIDSDGTLHGDETSTHRPFAEGYIDFHALAPELLAVPGIQWWCIDLCFWAGSHEILKPSLDYVRGLLATTAAA